MFKGQWRSSKILAGGGILLDQGIHLLDILIFFCGDFLDVKSFISNDFGHMIEQCLFFNKVQE